MDDLEFCPFCGKRTNIDIGFDYTFVDTCPVFRDNNNLIVSYPATGKPVLNIDLQTNQYQDNHTTRQPYLRISCKSFHWTVNYSIIECANNKLNTYIDKCSFFLTDKTDIMYNALSNYLTNTTEIHMVGKDFSQALNQSLIHFDNFNKKHLVKKFQALTLLS